MVLPILFLLDIWLKCFKLNLSREKSLKRVSFDLQDPKCIFCQRDQLKIILENDLAAAFWDIHPVNPGHLLVIPKAHKPTFFDLEPQELLAINDLLHQGKQLIDQKFAPDGFNLGVNIGKYGGQVVMHCHFHLIPRYRGDVPNPIGGIRNSLPPQKVK